MVFSSGKGLVGGSGNVFVVYVGKEVFKKGGNVMDVCLMIVFIGR